MYNSKFLIAFLMIDKCFVLFVITIITLSTLLFVQISLQYESFLLFHATNFPRV